MSKSYNNTIPLFCTEKQLLKLIRKIKTNSLEPGEPKETEGCALFQLYSAFATDAQIAEMAQDYANGIGWGEAKNRIFELLNETLKTPRQRYHELLEDPAYIESMMQKGAERARAEAVPFMAELRRAVGIAPFV